MARNYKNIERIEESLQNLEEILDEAFEIHDKKVSRDDDEVLNRIWRAQRILGKTIEDVDHLIIKYF